MTSKLKHISNQINKKVIALKAKTPKSKLLTHSKILSATLTEGYKINR